MSTTTKATELSQLAANLTVDSDNVGIGTDTPTEKLDVVGNIKTTGSVTASTFSGALTGNAVTATRLETARTINGISFDGSANITLPGTDIAEGTRTTTTVPITSSTGTNATLSAASTTLAGVMTSADKTKLDGIAAGAQVNVATNLTYTTATTTGTVNSSTGTNATIPAATVSLAGLMTNADKTKLDGIAAGAQVNTVTSVAGKTGAVTLVKADVGLSNVDNTSDATKNSATATLTNKTLTNPVINGFTGDTSVINIGSGQLVKDANGNVGIGTSSPSFKFQVGDSATNSFFGIINDATNGTAIRVGGTGAGNNILRFLATSDVERMRIDTSGNVGIGTSSPAAKLEVNGICFINNTADPISRLIFRNSVTGSGFGTGLDIRQDSLNARIMNFSNGFMAFTTNNAERARIGSSGNVGIGTSSPATKLDVETGTSATGVTVRASSDTGSVLQLGVAAHVAGLPSVNGTGNGLTIGTNAPATVRFFTGTSERARIDASGNLLVGTTTALGKVTTSGVGSFAFVAASNDGGFVIKSTNLTAGGPDQFFVRHNLGSVELGNARGHLRLFANNIEHARIDSSGTLILNRGQIQFPATQVASANANTLDDYEEGTWTPVFSSGSFGTILNFTYTKIGRVVHITGYLSSPAGLPTSGLLQISGLPFPGNASFQMAQLWYNSSSNTFDAAGYIAGNSTTLNVRPIGGAPSALSELSVQMTYITHG